MKSKLFDITIPENFELTIDNHSKIRCTNNVQKYDVQPAYFGVQFFLIEDINTKKEKSLLDNYIYWTEGFNTEVVSTEDTQINDLKALKVYTKTDAEFRGKAFKINYLNVCLLLDDLWCADFQFVYESKDENIFKSLAETTLQSLKIKGDAKDLKNAKNTDEKEAEAQYKQTLQNEEEQRQKEENKRYETLNFKPPKQHKQHIKIGDFSFSILEPETRWYIAKDDRRIFVEFALKTEDLKNAISKKLLSDWQAKAGITHINFYAPEIFNNNVPTGQFLLKKGKIENEHRVYVQLQDFDYYLKFYGYVYLQNGWFGMEGWLQNEYDTAHRFRISLYKQFDIKDLDWTQYTFNREEFLMANPSQVHYLSYSDEELTEFPDKILACQQLKNLQLVGGKTEWKSNKYESTYGALKSVPEAIGELTELQRLSLSNIEINTLPKSIGKLKNLEYLYIHACKISELPLEVFQLPKLKYLTISRTQLQHLPEQINLPEIITLSLENNQLTTLPESVCNQPKLRTLYLENNPLQRLPQQLSDAKYDIRLSIEDKRKLLDFEYQGADGKGLTTWKDEMYIAQYDAELIQPIINVINKNNLTTLKTPLLATVKKAIGFKHLEEDTYLKIGNHRFGGYPDFPESIPYPRYDNDYDKTNYIYEFIAQINLADVAHLQDYLPKTGILYFFLTTHHDVYDGSNSKPAKVIWYNGDMSALKSGKTLSFTKDNYYEAVESPAYQAYNVEAFKMNSAPDYYAYRQNKHWFKDGEENELYKKLSTEDYNDKDRLYDVFEEPVRKLASYNYAINSYMFTQHESPELQASLSLKGKPNDWVILLKVTSSGDFQWGDAGDLAFVIHKSDLAKGDFTNVFCTIESS